MRHKSGFTLIELIVVIAIIAILAAILFPVFAKAREKARQISCASNMKQLALAVLQYNQDYDESFPMGGNYGLGGWGGRVYTYVKSTGAYKCPDDPTGVDNSVSPSRVPVSYAMNSNLGLVPGIAALNAPASTVLIFETQGAVADVTDPVRDMPYDSGYNPGNQRSSPSGNGGDGGAGWIDWYYGAKYAGSAPNKTGYGNPPCNVGAQWYTSNPVHTDGSNFALADGHVKYLRGNQVSPGQYAQSSTDAQSNGCGYAAGTDALSGKFGATFSGK
ncbi:hypothetical protein CCAX7_19990 [Capsulimonas corticalis]|uniref:Uncharacterized protein n=1 Tax=Capsulimonas corticalis TaxID=2219043 RepID=A0A402D2H2_9BACT|nr:DUF1559 domain-containing protein [Capsulimonas corticalis]BDI29948.1 hypothetical protein CCAX7_19990 [Capsulimonas corticalis]